MKNLSRTFVVIAIALLVGGLMFQRHYYDQIPISPTLTPIPRPKEESPLKQIKIRPQPVYVYKPREVKLDFTPREADMTSSYFTAEDLKKMAEGDEKLSWGGSKNTLREFQTSVGVFRVVSSCNRYSINPDAKHSGGMRQSTLQLPSGQWRYDLGLEYVLETHGRVYLITSHFIYEWIDETKIRRVVAVDDYKSVINDPVKGYVEVHRSSDSGFGGLLKPKKDGTWKFYPYRGKYTTWVENAEEKEDKLILTLYQYWLDQKRGRPLPQVEFDPQTGQFRDLP